MDHDPTSQPRLSRAPAAPDPHADAVRPAWAARDPLLRAYFDEEWGVPVREERALFEALSLEAFQTGLAWSTVLRKREAFRAAFAGFDPDAVAAFTEADVERLLQDAGIVRSAAKIRATIGNAAATVALRAEGGLVDLVWSFEPSPEAVAAHDPAATRSPESTALAAELKRRGFAFVGPTTMYALMEAIGMIAAVRKPARG